MQERICPRCDQNVYSADNKGKWTCPYCGYYPIRPEDSNDIEQIEERLAYISLQIEEKKKELRQYKDTCKEIAELRANRDRIIAELSAARSWKDD